MLFEKQLWLLGLVVDGSSEHGIYQRTMQPTLIGLNQNPQIFTLGGWSWYIQD